MSVLRYRPAPESSWYHYLYGPRQDGTDGWIILPEIAPLDTDHLSRMSAAIAGLEAPNAEDFSLSVVNVSLGETGLLAGRGGLAILLHFNLADGRDRLHRFVHVLACYDRGLDRTVLHNTIWTFLRRVTRGRTCPDRPVDRYFAAYCETRNRQEAFLVLDRYLRRIEPFDFVPFLPPSRELVLEEGGLWPDILDVTSTSETWEEVIQGIAAISASLYASTLPWFALTTSVTLPVERQGMIIRFLARPQFKKHDNPLIILEELDADRAAVALLPVVEQEITQLAFSDEGALLYDEQTEDRTELFPGESDDEGVPAPPMLLDEPDTITDDVIDLSTPMTSTLGVGEVTEESERTENVIISSPAVARPRSTSRPTPYQPPPQPRRWLPLLIAGAVLLVLIPMLRLIACSEEVPITRGLAVASPAAIAQEPIVAEPAIAEPAAAEPAPVDEEPILLAWVSPDGDASGVWLKREPAGQPVYLSGREPFDPGEYLVIAQFTPEGTAKDTVRISLTPQDDVQVRCQAAKATCQVIR